MTIKICTGCGLPKNAEEDFSWSIRGIKRHPRCKTCRNEERLVRYKKNKEAELEYKWDRQQRKREEARQYVTQYLSSHPCVDCGETDPMVLTFDHVRGQKRMNVAELVNRGYLIEEIHNCGPTVHW
jgi:hypothetical protein